MVNECRITFKKYSSQIISSFDYRPYERVFKQKPRKMIKLTANASKNLYEPCKPFNDSLCYRLRLDTHNGNFCYHPQVLKVVSGTHTDNIVVEN